ncbi:MAG TPA: 1-acyl-sn-glycerol-3-phosphate acyltransferase [Actinomycetota bacterium]
MSEANVIPMEARRPEAARCKARTRDGKPCANRARESGYCARHEPAAADEGGSSVERRLQDTLAFLRRRMTGAYPTDDFGFDADLTETALIPALRPLYERWWRVETRGIRNVPTTGGALLAANHSGVLPWDGLMMKVALHDELGVALRILAGEVPFKIPFLGSLMRKSGDALACEEDAVRMLGTEAVVGVFPEGYEGLGKPFRERYKLQRFGRVGFAEVAIKTGVPIVPVAVVGAEEIHPMLANLRPLARLLGLPYVPLTPTFPLLGPLGAVPLPTKWIIEFGEPIATASFTPDAALDPMFVYNLTDQVREAVQQMVYRKLMSRRGVFA